MEKSGPAPRFARFGPFEADLPGGLLTRRGVRVRLGVQPFQVLALLLSRPGQIVTREEIRSELWPNGTYVDFEGSLNSALKKLRAALEDDPKDSRFIETVPKRGYRFIMPVTPAIASTGKGKEFPGQRHWPSSAAPATPQRRILGTHGLWLQWKLVGLGSFALIVAILVSMIALDRIFSPPPSAQTPAHPIARRTSIAVLGFRNVSGGAGHDWISTALSEMLDTELAGAGKLRLVPAEDVANLRHSSPWLQTGSLDPKTTARIGYALGCDFLVLGSYTAIGAPGHSQLRIDARLQDAMTGKILTETAAGGNEMSLFQIISQLGAGLRKGLSIPAPNESDELGLMASMPLDPETARFYSLGLKKLRDFDASAAKDLLIQATKSDPKFSLAHAMLARAWSQLGYQQERKAEIKIALQLSKDLTRPERLMVEGDYYDSLGNHDKAASVYQALFDMYPDDLDYGLQLALEQKLAGHGSQSVATLEALRRLPSPASQDARIDLAEEWYAKSKAQELRLEHDAMSKALAQGKKLLYADAKRRECMTLDWSDHPDAATASCETAYKIFLAAGNRVAAADAVRLMADAKGALGQRQQAIVTYQRALGILNGTGDLEKTAAAMNNLAIALEGEGQLGRAAGLYDEAERNFRRAGDTFNEVLEIANHADVLYERGELKEASHMYKECIRQAESKLDPPDPAYALYRLANLELDEGRVEDARRDAETSVRMMRPESGAIRDRTTAMDVLGRVLETQGDLANARRTFEAALAIQKRSGTADLAAESQNDLADLALREGHPDEAVRLLNNSVAEFESQRGRPDASGAYILLSRALLAQGNVAEARKFVDRGISLSQNSPDPALKLPVAIEQARVGIAEIANRPAPKHDFSVPRSRLRGVISSARRLGYYNVECEARLALEELETKLNPLSGRAHLSALSAEARRHGMMFISREAEALQKTSTPLASSVSEGLRASTAHP